MNAETRLERAMTLVEEFRQAGEIDAEKWAQSLDALGGELAGARDEVETLRREVDGLKAENRRLRQSSGGGEEEPVATCVGCYQFANDDSLYCPHCWDRSKEKSRTTRITARHRVCSVCRAPLSGR